MKFYRSEGESVGDVRKEGIREKSGVWSAVQSKLEEEF